MEKIKTLIIFFGLFFITHPGFSQKIAVVDFRRVFEEYNKTKEYEKELEIKKERIRKEIDSRTKKIKDLQDKIPLLDKKEQKSKKENLENLIKDLDDYRRDKALDIRREYNDKIMELRDDILKVVDSYAKKRGYDLVIDTAIIVYNNKVLDITDEIIKIINKRK